ncbi:MAG: DUF1800 domain-containing protein [Phycisphaerales bacterium]
MANGVPEHVVGAAIDSGTSPREARLSRRGFLGVRRAAAAIGAVAASAGAARAVHAGPPSVSADVDPGALTRKLVERITFGATEAEVSSANALGFSGYLEAQMALTAGDEFAPVTARLAGVSGSNDFPWLNSTNSALFAQQSVSIGPIVSSLIDSTIYRAVFSRRQLFEKMVEFWSDHFNIDVNVDQAGWLKLLDDRTVIRPNALGTFPALVNASARSAAMLNYLDNDVSRVGAINENYARELMELHTLGVDGGYTQNDVIEVARCLTGWTWWNRNPPLPDDIGTFRFNGTLHDNGSKTLSPIFNLANPNQNLVIGANGGMNDGLTVLDILTRHPNTARYVARKLCRRFIGEDCPQPVIDRVQNAYLTSTPIGDIKTMLRAMLTPNILNDATARLKRPFHLFASAMRVVLPSEANMTAWSFLKTTHLRPAGHLPFNWNPPDGYPDANSYWSGQLLPRWNFGANLVTSNNASGGTSGGINGVGVNAAAVDAVLAVQVTAVQALDRLNATLFGGGMLASERARILAFLPAVGNLTATQKRDAIGLAIDTPGFQWY